MAITRRQFIKRTGLFTAGTVLGPGLFANPLVRRALAFQNKYFIVLFLDGGNDGLNTVVPYDNGGGTLRSAYTGHRNTGTGGLQLSTGVLGPTLLTNLALANDGKDPNTGCQLAFHPGFADNPGGGLPSGGLKAIYDSGRLAVIQGCGYPEYSLSHDESRTIWETGNPGGYAPFGGTGWVGRYLVGNAVTPPPPYQPNDIPGVNISDSVVGEFRTNGTSVLAVRRLADFGFPYDYDYGDDDAAKEAAFEALYGSAAGNANATVKYLGNSGLATEDASQNYPQAHGAYVADRSSFNTMYGGNGLDTNTSRGFREIAKIIYAVENNLVSGVNARFFQLTNGGYDTHSDQGAAATDGQHYALHSEVGNAIRLFWEDLKTMGAGGSDIRNKVCILVWSEFSRRIPQNDNGTDHGSQGPMFVIGGTVNGGVYGNHPNINDPALDDEGNTEYRQDANGGYRSTDFRDVYGTVLTRWLDMSSATVTSSVLRLDVGQDPDFYWTSANFNLGFVP
jgi:uncharacterized protein (DUF1501 family)